MSTHPIGMPESIASEARRDALDGQHSVQPDTRPGLILAQSTRRTSTVHDVGSSNDASACHVATHNVLDSKSLQTTERQEREIDHIPHLNSVPSQATIEAAVLANFTSGTGDSRVEGGLRVIVTRRGRAGSASTGSQTPTGFDTPPPPYAQSEYSA